jgi:hypothetical protein
LLFAGDPGAGQPRWLPSPAATASHFWAEPCTGLSISNVSRSSPTCAGLISPITGLNTQRRCSQRLRSGCRGDDRHRQQAADRRQADRRAAALQMVAVAATGTNNIDLDACRSRGIVVSNIRGYAAHTVPEHVFGAAAGAVAQSRRLPAGSGGTATGSAPSSSAASITRSATCTARPWRDRQRQPGQRCRPAGRGLRHARAAQRAQGRD